MCVRVYSNITAGTSSQIQAVLDEGIVPTLMDMLRGNREEWAVQKECLWAAGNVCNGGRDEQIRHLIAQGAVQVFGAQLSRDREARMMLVVLETLENMLRVGKKDAAEEAAPGDGGRGGGGVNAVADALEECGALDKLEELQHHEDQEVYEGAVRLLETYFNAEEDDEDEEADDAPVAVGRPRPGGLGLGRGDRDGFDGNFGDFGVGAGFGFGQPQAAPAAAAVAVVVGGGVRGENEENEVVEPPGPAGENENDENGEDDDDEDEDDVAAGVARMHFGGEKAAKPKKGKPKM
jgi:hypothetical protein